MMTTKEKWRYVRTSKLAGKERWTNQRYTNYQIICTFCGFSSQSCSHDMCNPCDLYKPYSIEYMKIPIKAYNHGIKPKCVTLILTPAWNRLLHKWMTHWVRANARFATVCRRGCYGEAIVLSRFEKMPRFKIRPILLWRCTGSKPDSCGDVYYDYLLSEPTKLY